MENNIGVVSERQRAPPKPAGGGKSCEAVEAPELQVAVKVREERRKERGREEAGVLARMCEEWW